MTSSTGIEASRRWTSKDGRLALCKRHVDPIFGQLGQSQWCEVTSNARAVIADVLGYEMPCDFCEMEYEARAFMGAETL